MKIVELRAENFKRLRAVQIRPDGAMVQVTGANGQGKTSVLDAIWAALGGLRGCAVSQPVRRGEEEARIRLDLGDYVVTRRFRRGEGGDVTASLTVTSADGQSVMRSPQAVLDGLVGELSFDPLAFARARPRDQVDQLRTLVPGFDFGENESRRKELFEERTEAGRAHKRARAAADAVSVPPGPRPEPIDVSAKINRLAAASQANVERAAERLRRERASDIAQKGHERAHQLMERASRLIEEADRLRKDAETANRTAGDQETYLSKLEPVPPDEDLAALRAAVDEARRHDAAITLHDDRARHEVQACGYEAAVKRLTGEMAALDEAKRAAVADAKLPVEGLVLGDDEVLLDGVPLADASDADRLRVSVAVAMALNPTLRVIRVREGSVLDSKSLAAVAAAVAERDYQCWVERVDESGEVGFVIVDGEVVARSDRLTGSE